MRNSLLASLFVSAVILSGPALAQEIVNQGIPLGNMVLRPWVDGSVAYDSRVRLNGVTGESDQDVYSQVAAGATLKNLPAVYTLSANASYGHRAYVEYTENDDDFYAAGASVGSGGSTGFRWQVGGDVAKTLNYDTLYDPAIGAAPPSILSDEASQRWSAQGTVSYSIPVSDKTVLVPEYTGVHYYQEIERGDTAEWQTHAVNLMLNHALSERLTLTAGGSYSLQTNDDEDGSVVTVSGGARGPLTDKSSWSIQGGMMYADYDLSGTDQGLVIDLQANWRATEKIFTYVFYGNRYEPGYSGGGARLVYRGGYGADWAFADRWTLGGQVLHDYDDEVGNGTATDAYGGSVDHFFAAQLSFQPTPRWSATLQGQYVNDEYATDQQVVSLSARYAY
jgi:hypothetical protein